MSKNLTMKDLQGQIIEVQKAVGQLAITIFVSSDYSHDSDLGRWAASLIDSDVAERLKDLKFVDGILHQKVIVDKDTVEWQPMEGLYWQE